MARCKNGEFDARLYRAAELMKEQRSEAEIKDELGLSKTPFNSLLLAGYRSQIQAFRDWKPAENFLQASDLPPSLVNQVREASGITDASQCNLIKVQRADGSVILTCQTSNSAKKSEVRAEVSLPSTSKASGQALPDVETKQSSVLPVVADTNRDQANASLESDVEIDLSNLDY